MADAVVVITSKPFKGEVKLKKKGCKICHNSAETGVAEAYRLIKNGGAKVFVIKGVSDDILKRMAERAKEFGNEVHVGLTPKQLLKLFES
jgi:NADPH:quinone reductase-like Zn-dependent oxidoreductase